MGGLIPTYFLAFGISGFGGLAILYRENNNTEIESMTSINPEYAYYRRMHYLIAIARFGIAMGITATELAAFTDQRLLPLDRRTDALALITMIVYALSSFAPLVNELEEPTPIIIFLIALFLVLLNIIYFDIPPPSPLIEHEKRIKKLKRELKKQLI